MSYERRIKLIRRLFRVIERSRIVKWLIIGMFVGEEFYQVSAKTYDIDLCLFLDPEEERLEAFLRSLVRVLRIDPRDISPWSQFMERIRRGEILVIEPTGPINFHIDIIPITPVHKDYEVFRDAFNNRTTAHWRCIQINIPTREYWIALKLVGFREKDKYHLVEMLRLYNILKIRINVNVLNKVLEKYPYLKNRWEIILSIAKKDYNLELTEEGYVILSSSHDS